MAARMSAHLRPRPPARARVPVPARLSAVALLLAGCAAATGGASAARSGADAPRAGAPGVGDEYFPELGNGGYDVQHYDVAMRVDPVSGRIEACTTVDAVASEALSSFDLDLWGLEVRSVEVDGAPARISRAGRELVVRPAAPLAAGRPFRAVVRYDGVPELAPDPSVARMGLKGVGWWKRDSGIYVVSECAGASSWLPSNDHPSDKATFTFAITVPAPWQVAANGLLEGVDEEGGQRTFRWRARDPMATYLATVNVVQLELEEWTGPGGLPLRLYHPADASEKELAAQRRMGDMIEHFATLFGPYPFEAFGGLITPEQMGGALETQTLPVYSRGMGEGVVAHELAHQWFGDCVSLAQWKDMWLNEGFASYAEWLWTEHERGPEALEGRAARAYRHLRGSRVGPPVEPGVESLFSGRVYQRGAYVLHMLRGELGDATFFALLRRWVADHRDGNATTADFERLADEVAGRSLAAFFQTYLRDPVVPELERYERRSQEEPEAPRRREE